MHLLLSVLLTGSILGACCADARPQLWADAVETVLGPGAHVDDASTRYAVPSNPALLSNGAWAVDVSSTVPLGIRELATHRAGFATRTGTGTVGVALGIASFDGLTASRMVIAASRPLPIESVGTARGLRAGVSLAGIRWTRRGIRSATEVSVALGITSRFGQFVRLGSVVTNRPGPAHGARVWETQVGMTMDAAGPVRPVLGLGLMPGRPAEHSVGVAVQAAEAVTIHAGMQPAPRRLGAALTVSLGTVRGRIAWVSSRPVGSTRLASLGFVPAADLPRK